MSTTPNGFHDPEDMFSHTRMSLGDHIEELRRHMLKALAGFLIAMTVGFFISKPVLEFINAPVQNELTKLYYKQRDNRVKKYVADTNNLPPDKRYETVDYIVPDTQPYRDLGAEELDPPLAGQRVLHWKLPVESKVKIELPIEVAAAPPSLQSLSPAEMFIVYMKVSVYCGIVLASPWIFYQLWMFVAAGLYPHERKHVHIWLPFSVVLFLCGVAVCEFVILPVGLQYLLSFNEWMGVEPNLRISDWLSFAIMMPLISGAAFQTPLVMFFMERVGIVTVEQYIKHWRIAIFGLTLAGALLAASPDPLSMMSLAVPMCLLYGVGILLCKYIPKHELDLDVPASEEMVEV